MPIKRLGVQQERTINDRQEGNEGERDFIDEYTASPEPGHDERDNDRAGARTQDRAGSTGTMTARRDRTARNEYVLSRDIT